MAASVFSSTLYGQLFPTGATGRLCADSAEIRAMLLVEGALAKAQGQLGIIPEISAAAIDRAAREVQVDPGALAVAMGQNGVSVPGLVAAFRKAMEAPEHAQYVHWGATSQDIIDTGLMLRLRQALMLAEDDLKSILSMLGAASDKFAEMPMAARTYGQHATPTSWGAVVAQWGTPLADYLETLNDVRSRSLWVSLSGAAGTSAALGAQSAALRAKLADLLELSDPERSWHTDRGPVLRIASWLCDVTMALAGIGRNLVTLASSDVGEISLSGAGASSTMPQKQNPVGPSILVALGIQSTGLRAALQSASTHEHQRDGSAWFAEWSVLPQIMLNAACGLQTARAVIPMIEPDTKRMAANLARSNGLIHAEALSFALAATMPRPDAQALTKKLCLEATETGAPLAELARAADPTLPASIFDPTAQMGEAPAIARTFAARVHTMVEG